jgi:LCP family protein required for cell wall assembly
MQLRRLFPQHRPPDTHRRALFLVLIHLIILSACAPAAPIAAPLPFILVTSAPNASPTPTPFQPSLSTPVPLSLETSLPTETPSPTPTAPPQATPTIDLAALFPTAAAPPVEIPENQPTALALLSDNETVNFLLIGSDKRPGSSYRTDTMVIAILWPSKAQVSLISIPRDLWIYIPTVGMQRINTAYQSGELNGYDGGGPALLRDTISYNLGIRIDHIAMVEFDGFRRIVDTLGGIDLPVACAYTDWRLIDPSYDPYNENNWWLYTVGPGQVHMDGDLALWYARSRSKSSDFDRGRRQQEVLRAIFSQALQTGTLSKIPQLYTDLSGAVTTDLGVGDLLRLAPYALNLTNASIRSYYIRPPYVSAWITPGGASVQLPNEAALQQLLLEATNYSTRAIERETVKVEIQNGSSFDTMDALAASRLNYAGYQTITSSADRRDYINSVLVDFTPAQDTQARSAILAALGLYTASEISLPDASNPASFRMILGNDYEPCFQPEQLSH